MPSSSARRRGRRVTVDDVLEFMRLLWAVDHELQRASKRMKRRLGVTGPQRLAVRMIDRRPEAAAQDVAAALHLHKSTVTGILQRLAEQGLISRSADAADRRRIRLRLTRQGQRISGAKAGTIERAVQQALSRVSVQALRGARDALIAVAETLQETTNRSR